MFLQDGIRRMTGVTLDVRRDSEVRRGIVIALLGNAPADHRGTHRFTLEPPTVRSSWRK